MYASRKVTMITWAKEWGPGFPGEEGGAHTLDYGRGEGGKQHRALLTPTAADTRSLRTPCLQLPKNPEASAHPAFAHYLSVSGLACLLSSLGASCQVLLLLNELLLLPAATACCSCFEGASAAQALTNIRNVSKSCKNPAVK